MMSNQALIKEPLENNNTVTNKQVDILTISQQGSQITVNIDLSFALSAVVVVFFVVILFRKLGAYLPRGFTLSEVQLKDPLTGSTAKIKADSTEKIIAHKIWTELVTRKAAIPFERDKDVIIQVYDSWYVLFGCIREQIAQVPIDKLQGRQKEDIEKLIDIATNILNGVIRPHLTTWQAHFKQWYLVQVENNTNQLPPQQLQQQFEHYEEIVTDIESVNQKLLDFANQLKVLTRA